MGRTKFIWFFFDFTVMFYFLYLDVYLIFFDLKRPNKENRTCNSEYMHTGDRSFSLIFIGRYAPFLFGKNFILWKKNNPCNYLNNYYNLNGCSLHLVYIFMKNVQKMYSLLVEDHLSPSTNYRQIACHAQTPENFWKRHLWQVDNWAKIKTNKTLSDI